MSFRTGRDKLGFLTPEQRSEYGAVYAMHMPGSLAAVMTWRDKPVTLRFVPSDGRMAIYQDGMELAAADIPPAWLAGIGVAQVHWDMGTPRIGLDQVSWRQIV